jgi:uncharacterized small protein (DUF1192 family)
MAADELSASAAATRQRLTRAAEDLLGAERAAELADRIALLASQIALVSAQDAEPLLRWPGQAGTAGGAKARDHG